MTRLADAEDWEFVRALLAEADSIISPLERIAAALERLSSPSEESIINASNLVASVLHGDSAQLLVWLDNPDSIGMALLDSGINPKSESMLCEAHYVRGETFEVGIGRLMATRIAGVYALNPDELPF